MKFKQETGLIQGYFELIILLPLMTMSIELAMWIVNTIGETEYYRSFMEQKEEILAKRKERKMI